MGFKEVALLEVHKQPAPCPVPPLHTRGTSGLFFLKKKRKQPSSLKGGIEFTLVVQQQQAGACVHKKPPYEDSDTVYGKPGHQQLRSGILHFWRLF